MKRYIGTPLRNIYAIAERISQHTGGAVGRSGEGYSVRCPCHGDKTPSLVIYEGRTINQFEYNYRVRCYAGCQSQEIERWISENLGISNYEIDGEHPLTKKYKEQQRGK